ncbi:MAG: hypothetical protein JEZ06_02130 [Anaerolineaceae bacterium]|nr:hypothetical protein [Anaerolineaceae bacterium]
MKKDIKNKVCNEIYRKYPDMDGVKPEVKPYSSNKELLIFNTKAKTSNGFSLTKTLRVVVNQEGKILKTTASR